MTAATLDRRAQRRAETRAEIVAAAWELAREQGLAGLSMRDLGARVGMRAPSVYSYFAAKDAIYDAMFRQGYEEFIEWMTDDTTGTTDVVAQARAHAHRFFTFCTDDPVRYQLLFLRTIPGFEPSPESYALAVRALEQGHRAFARWGITDPDAADLATAVLTGLTSQQIANDPGGDRWERLVDRAAAMLVRELAPPDLSSSLPDQEPHPPSRKATP